jgi:hypothetical protein
MRIINKHHNSLRDRLETIHYQSIALLAEKRLIDAKLKVLEHENEVIGRILYPKGEENV